ncbi:MAG: hypothetical protein P1U46_00915 [Patescibacteria group bacterium]|nr:hypothetical protein [Patescibacteria group bacterium]
MKFFNNFFLFSIACSVQSTCRSHFSERSIAIGLVTGIFANIIFIITIIGTDNNIPTTHHNAHQNQRDIIITNGLRFNLFHINFGSTIFHINI